MAQNVFLGYPEINFKAASIEYSHAYATSNPFPFTVHGGRARFAELASAIKFTNYIDITSSTGRTLSFFHLSRIHLLRQSLCKSVVLRKMSARQDYPDTIASSNLRFWFDPGRGVVDSATTGLVTTITERKSSDTGTAGGNVWYSEMSDFENWLLYSDDFTNGAWFPTNASVVATNVADPLLGAYLANYKLVEDTAGGVAHYMNQLVSGFISGQTYRFIVYLKAAGRTKVAPQFGGAAFGSVGCEVDLTLGSITSTFGTPISSSINDVGNGWYKVQFTKAATATNTAYYSINLRDAAGASTYTGDGSSGVFIYAPEVQTNDAQNTTYTKTTVAKRHKGLKSNRACKFDTAAGRITYSVPAYTSTGDMSAFAVVRPQWDNSAYTGYIMTCEVASASGWALIFNGVDRAVYYRANQAGTSQTVTSSSGLTNNATTIIGFVKSGTTVTLYFNGASVGSNTVTNPLAPTANFKIGGTGGGDGFPGYIGEAMVWNAALNSGEITGVNDFLTARWITSPSVALHNIGTLTTAGPNLEDYLQGFTPSISTYYRIEFDSDETSKRTCGNMFFGTGENLGRDPKFSRTVTGVFDSNGRRRPAYRYELEYEGVTNANRNTFLSNVKQYDSINSLALSYYIGGNPLAGQDTVQCIIERAEFEPTEHGKNRVYLRLLEEL